MKKIVVIGGDSRYLYLIEKLKNYDFDIDLIGYDNANFNVEVNKKELSDINISEYDYTILPVTSISNDGNIRAEFSNNQINVANINFNIVKDGSCIIAGIKTMYVEQLNLKNIFYFMDCDDVAIYNSVATAEGVILKIIENTKHTIYGSNILVLGYGRCGQTIARYLKCLGANVSLLVRDNKKYADAKISGYNPYYVEELINHLGEFDTIINTIPELVFDKDKIDKISLITYLLEIASIDGFDIDYAISKGIKAERFMGIPAIVAPISSALIIFNKIRQVILK